MSCSCVLPEITFQVEEEEGRGEVNTSLLESTFSYISTELSVRLISYVLIVLVVGTLLQCTAGLAVFQLC